MAGTNVAELQAEPATCARDLRYESVVAACASALLADDAADGVSHALRTLLHASDDKQFFVAENVEDQYQGPCTRLVRVVTRDRIFELSLRPPDR